MTSDTPDWTNLHFDADGHLIDLSGEFGVETYGPPPPRQWAPITTIEHPRGWRVCISTEAGPQYDHRAATDIYTSTGTTFVDLVTEDQWYRWLDTDPDNRPPRIPRAVPWPTRHLWIEVLLRESGSAI